MDIFINALQDYRKRCNDSSIPDVQVQLGLIDRFSELTKDGPRALERTHWKGHLTASALVTNEDCDHVLLTLHRKLGLWLQLGGHADGDPDLSQVAMREAVEESGLQSIEFWDVDRPIFDLDIHWIPERKNEPRHLHYDVRFLARASTDSPLVLSAESTDLRWVPLSDAYGLSEEWSMHRQFDKLKCLHAQNLL